MDFKECGFGFGGMTKASSFKSIDQRVSVLAHKHQYGHFHVILRSVRLLSSPLLRCARLVAQANNAKMRMPEPSPILQPKSEHPIHPNMRKPTQRHPGNSLIGRRPRSAQQDDRRRLRVHGVVERCAGGRVG